MGGLAPKDLENMCFIPRLKVVQIADPDNFHTCKKRVMWQRRLFWPKKICGKSA